MNENDEDLEVDEEPDLDISDGPADMLQQVLNHKRGFIGHGTA